MITLKGVTKKFGNKTAVDGLSFKAESGEIIGFLGPNGAGKTTTMRLLLGYLSPTKGTVTVHNLNPQEDRIEILKQVGYLPENNPLYYEMSVYEYLAFIAQIKQAPDVYEMAESVGLSDVLDTRIEELSRGFKQRVGLAAALISNPDLLVLDEPTSGLDPLEQEKIRDLIKSLSKNKTILFSTHILSEVEAIATRLIIIHHGLLVYDGPKPRGIGAVEKLFKKLVH